MPSTLREKQNGRLLTEIAMSVRMVAGGQMEYYRGVGDDLALLEQAIKDWEPTLAPWTAKVDEAVKQLVIACIEEATRDDNFWVDDWTTSDDE